MKLEYPSVLPFSGIPIPGRNNPFLVVPTRWKVLVEVNIGGSGCSISGADVPGLSSIICRYKAGLEEALGGGIGVEIRVEAPSITPRSTIIALLTLALLEAYGIEAGYRFTPEDLLEYTSILDASSGYRGWPSSLLRALRESAMSGHPLIHRMSEGSVALPGFLDISTHGCMPAEYSSLSMDKRVVDSLTHLSGLLTLGIAEAFRTRSLEALKEYWRMEDGLWYAAWGIQPLQEYKTAPDIGGVCRIEVSQAKDS